MLGLGNLLLSDDGIGIHVVRALEPEATDRNVTLRDGGTIGFALLPEIEECEALIAIDAMQFDAAPGAVRTFVGAEMDRQLWGKKKTAHEVALADLISAARLSGRVPERRALVGIRPGSTEWGLAPTESVLAAIPVACDAVRTLLEDWTRGST